MPRTYVGRVGAGALISAVFAGGLLGLTRTDADYCTGSPKCSGPPPPAYCTSPDCVGGTPPNATLLSAGRIAGVVSAAGTGPSVNCPPPDAASTSSGDKPNC
jgi:hypothetical protein